MARLDNEVNNPIAIRDPTTPQGRATTWLIGLDERTLCPSDDKLVQRWALAVMYFSTEGDDWFECSATDVMFCGTSGDFLNKEPFLSPVNECQWAGIECNVDACVTEVVFEENNLAGTIPSEIALLTDLAIWGMERGQMIGTIPTEVGRLTDLVFLDLDFNRLTGTLPTELYLLTRLIQLDLNNNELSGNIEGIGTLTDVDFLQLHSNLFTGTVPESIGNFERLNTFTLHNTLFVGTMPASVCSLRLGGSLVSLIADCDPADPEIVCDCCTTRRVA